jgi:hypothetical protein
MSKRLKWTISYDLHDIVLNGDDQLKIIILLRKLYYYVKMSTVSDKEICIIYNPSKVIAWSELYQKYNKDFVKKIKKLSIEIRKEIHKIDNNADIKLKIYFKNLMISFEFSSAKVRNNFKKKVMKQC